MISITITINSYYDITYVLCLMSLMCLPVCMPVDPACDAHQHGEHGPW